MIQAIGRMPEFSVTCTTVVQTKSQDTIETPRGIAHKASEKLQEFGLTHTNWGPEIEFFVFDTINVYPSPYAATHSGGGSGYSIESKESPWAKGNVSYCYRYQRRILPITTQRYS